MDKLKIENLDLYYEKFHALKGINLSIPRNRIAAFIGASGHIHAAGLSTRYSFAGQNRTR